MYRFQTDKKIITIVLVLVLALMTSCATDKAEVKQVAKTSFESDENSGEANNPESAQNAITVENAITEDESVTEEETVMEEEMAAPPDIAGRVLPVYLDPSWTYAGHSAINSGCAVLYRASQNRKDVVIGVNAGHGTVGGTSVKTFCHPDGTAKVTGGSTSAGSIKAFAVSSGMIFNDGAKEADVALQTAQLLKDRLLAEGYDVLMLRDGIDVQLDNVARTVIANNMANCLISLHWDGDGLGYDKGCFYISTPAGIKNMEPVASNWPKHEALGESLIAGLRNAGCKICGNGKMAIDLTQTCYSTIPSVDVELGNQASKHDAAALSVLAEGLAGGIRLIY
ncbi:MAG: N-acetylmuramoyl-L-alanine amidase [Lachnospiraceae bacterium]|nr:N-acetylmuramoyl-L-alanine amidase [Lachnospiraceae bacterium]